MGYESRLIRVEDVDPDFAAAWDALPAARGRQADFLDSHAWLAAWSQRPSRGTTAALRIPAVLADGRPVALLPLEVRSRGRWESAATRAVHPPPQALPPGARDRDARRGGGRPAGRRGRAGRGAEAVPEPAARKGTGGASPPTSARCGGW